MSTKIPNAETSEMTKWHLTWFSDEEDEPNTATFYLPEGVDPRSIDWTGSLIGLVDLMAHGHKYTLKKIP